MSAYPVEPCPPWCDQPHDVDDGFHGRWVAGAELHASSLNSPKFRASWSVNIEQLFTQVEPEVTLEVEGLVRMTSGEAAALGKALLDGAALARPVSD